MITLRNTAETAIAAATRPAKSPREDLIRRAMITAVSATVRDNKVDLRAEQMLRRDAGLMAKMEARMRETAAAMTDYELAQDGALNTAAFFALCEIGIIAP